MQTKEDIEKEIFENKKKIIKQKKIDILRRINNFKSGNNKLYSEFKKSFGYFIYIIISVTVILMQLDISVVKF